MKKPEVTNPKLKVIVDLLWTNDPNPIGDGSMADAIRNELHTGNRQKGSIIVKKARILSLALKIG